MQVEKYDTKFWRKDKSQEIRSKIIKLGFMNQKDGDNIEWENMESLERREPISLVEIWKNPIVVREERHRRVVGYNGRQKEREKGYGRMGRPLDR